MESPRHFQNTLCLDQQSPVIIRASRDYIVFISSILYIIVIIQKYKTITNGLQERGDIMGHIQKYHHHFDNHTLLIFIWVIISILCSRLFRGFLKGNVLASEPEPTPTHFEYQQNQMDQRHNGIDNEKYISNKCRRDRLGEKIR
jgi:hypothetical protein